MDIDFWLQRAVDAAVDNVKFDNGGPFGAVVVMPSGVSYVGVNRVTSLLDPTAHAEVQAIRLACESEGTFSLEGAVLYSSCEPCPMCLGAALWSRVSNVYFAANSADAAAAGFDDAEFYRLITEGNVAQPFNLGSKLAPFEAWDEFGDKVRY